MGGMGGKVIQDDSGVNNNDADVTAGLAVVG